MDVICRENDRVIVRPGVRRRSPRVVPRIVVLILRREREREAGRGITARSQERSVVARNIDDRMCEGNCPPRLAKFLRSVTL